MKLKIQNFVKKRKSKNSPKKGESQEFIKITLDPKLLHAERRRTLNMKYDNLVSGTNKTGNRVQDQSQKFVWTAEDQTEIGRGKTYVMTKELEELYNDIFAVREALGEVSNSVKNNSAAITKFKSELMSCAKLLRKNAKRFPNSYPKMIEIAKQLDAIGKEKDPYTKLQELLAYLPTLDSQPDQTAVLNKSSVTESLQRLGISVEVVNIIFPLVIQQRVGWLFRIASTVQGLCELIVKDSSIENFVTVLDGESRHTEVTYDKKTKETQLNVSIACCYLNDNAEHDEDKKIKFGVIESQIVIAEDKKITVKNLQLIINKNSLNSCMELQKFSEVLSSEEQTNGPLPTKFKDRITRNPWKTAIIVLGVVSFIVGVALVATGVGSPLGAALGALGVKLAFPAIVTAILSGVSLSAVSTIATATIGGIHRGFQYLKAKVTGKISKIQEYTFSNDGISCKPIEYSPTRKVYQSKTFERRDLEKLPSYAVILKETDSLTDEQNQNPPAVAANAQVSPRPLNKDDKLSVSGFFKNLFTPPQTTPLSLSQVKMKSGVVLPKDKDDNKATFELENNGVPTNS